MIISKKKFEQAVQEAKEAAMVECDKAHWHNHEMETIHKEVAELRERLEALENKGRKPRRSCPCVFPRFR